LRYAGNGIGYENVIMKGDPGELKASPEILKFLIAILILTDRCQFVAYYTKGDKVIAVAR